MPENADPARLELGFRAAGLSVVEQIELKSEWREAFEESGDGRTSRQLLHVALGPLRAEHDVGGLEVPVDHAQGVGMGQGAEDPVDDGPDDREAQPHSLRTAARLIGPPTESRRLFGLPWDQGSLVTDPTCRVAVARLTASVAHDRPVVCGSLRVVGTFGVAGDAHGRGTVATDRGIEL